MQSIKINSRKSSSRSRDYNLYPGRGKHGDGIPMNNGCSFEDLELFCVIIKTKHLRNSHQMSIIFLGAMPRKTNVQIDDVKLNYQCRRCAPVDDSNFSNAYLGRSFFALRVVAFYPYETQEIVQKST